MLKNTKHNLILAGMVASLVVSGSIIMLMNRFASAVTDTCTGVNTTFTATAPSTVTAGKSFTISNITSHPDNSYGFTVTSSTLNISATNATPASYSQNNTSTDPSPTTGAQTYTAYFPNWTLTASGSAGSTITVKLVSASAVVTGVGTINCPLTATLATVNITAPASSSSPSSSSTNSTPKSSTTTPAPTTNTPVATSTDNQTATTQSNDSNHPTAAAQNSTKKPAATSHTKRKMILILCILELAILGYGSYVILSERAAAKPKL